MNGGENDKRLSKMNSDCCTKMLFIFDCDWTIIDGNTDSIIFDHFLTKEENTISLKHFPEASWPEIMSKALTLSLGRFSIEDVSNKVSSMKLDDSITRLFGLLNEIHCPIHMISSGNDFLISALLQANSVSVTELHALGVDFFFSKGDHDCDCGESYGSAELNARDMHSFTNWASFQHFLSSSANTAQRIEQVLVKPSPPPFDGCAIDDYCVVSGICKGAWVRELRARYGEDTKIVFVGDGRGDLHAVTALTERDTVLARAGFPLCKAIGRLQAKHPTTTGHSILAERGSTEANVLAVSPPFDKYMREWPDVRCGVEEWRTAEELYAQIRALVEGYCS